MEFHHPPNFPWILAAILGSENSTGFPRSIVVSFLLGLWVLFAWVSSGCPDPSSTEVDTGTREVSLLIRSSRSRVWISPTVDEEDEDEEDEEERLSCIEGRSRGRTWQAWNNKRNEVLRVAEYPNPVFNEMWFLTIAPFIRIPVFIAKLPERQYCWRVFEDFHSQEFIQFFDIHCSSPCVWPSPLAVMTIGGLHDFVKVSISASFNSFLLIMCIDALESTTNSRSSRLNVWCRQAPISESEKKVALFLLDFSNTFGQLPRGSRISEWRAMAFVNLTRWIGFCRSELFRKIDDNFGGSMSWKTQPNCRVSDDLHPTGPWLNSWRVSRFTTCCHVPPWL